MPAARPRKTAQNHAPHAHSRKPNHDAVSTSERPIEAIGYIRVSTQDQADSGLGMDAQRTRIEAQAAANGWKLLRIYDDPGVSAKTLDRPGLQAALEDLRPGRVLLALKLDRLTRSVRDLYDLTRIIEAAGAEWACVQEKFDTTTATGRLILAIMVQLSQWERETISERTCSALATKRRRGERLGTTPLGYRTIEDADGVTHVEEDPDEMYTVRMARELHDSGLSLRQVAKALTLAGRPTKRGGKWEAMTVSKLLKARYIERAAAEAIAEK